MDDVQCPVWLPHFSTDIPAGTLTLRGGAAHQLIALSQHTQLLISLGVTDDSVLEINIMPNAVPAPASVPLPVSERLTAQQHLNHWMQILGSDTTGPARRQAEKEVGYWRREVRAEHRRLNKK